MSDFRDGYSKAIELLDNLGTPHGFVAADAQKDNYFRIWSRDGVIIGLAALLTGEERHRETFKNTLLTLAEYQGEHGEIPSNVAPQEKKVSFGGTTGRVDAPLWFVIGCIQYYKHTKDEAFLERIFPCLEKCIFLLGAWEFNLKGFLYVPPTGDWADEWIQQGYVLYDQLLYYAVLNEYSSVVSKMGRGDADRFRRKAEGLKAKIHANFWIHDKHSDNPDIYHQIIFLKGQEQAKLLEEYWIPYFSPFGCGFYFDALANTLASVFGIATVDQVEKTDTFIAKTFAEKTDFMLAPFHPVVTPEHARWNELQVAFSFSFKNKPYEFHNGGLWSMVTGFYVFDLARRGKTDLANRYLEGIHRANFRSVDGEEEWGFYEFLHGQTFQPMGTRHQGWSAAAAIFAHHAIQNPQNTFL